MAIQTDKPLIALETSFKFGAVDGIKTEGLVKLTESALGPLAGMVGTWSGKGFNTIFRPESSKTPTVFPKPPVPPPSDNVLELNLTSESTTFTAVSGIVPNRGLFAQPDLALSGLTYLQQISDVTSGAPVGIHIEPGIWVVIPPTITPADASQTVARMASIPHGTTINAQGTTKVIAGPPVIPVASITPFNAGGPIPFASQTVANGTTPRLPQELTALSAEGKITQAMLTDPNTVLRTAIAGQTILSTTQISISTNAVPPITAGGGTDNIEFLGPNAQAVQMTATFWIETVERKITIPPFKRGGTAVAVPLSAGVPEHVAPRLLVDPGRDVTKETVITLHFTQIQYSQTVMLNFAGLSWPHVSVATLVSADPIEVPPSAWD